MLIVGDIPDIKHDIKLHIRTDIIPKVITNSILDNIFNISLNQIHNNPKGFSDMFIINLVNHFSNLLNVQNLEFGTRDRFVSFANLKLTIPNSVKHVIKNKS